MDYKFQKSKEYVDNGRAIDAWKLLLAKINFSIMEVLGRVKLINPVQQIVMHLSKRELVVTTEEQYPQHILIEFAQDKTRFVKQL